MPPPRLAKSLRPCHPRGPAHHARRISQTARAQSSTARGDGSQGVGSIGHGNTAKDATGQADNMKKAYASVLERMSGIASLGFKTVPTDSVSQSTRRNSSPVPQEHPKPGPNGAASPGFTIRKHILLDRPPVPQEHPKPGTNDVGSPRFTIRRRVRKDGIVTSTQRSQVETRSTQLDLPSQKEDSLDSLKELDLDAIQEQIQHLQQLYQRVATLQAALETKLTIAESINQTPTPSKSPNETIARAPGQTEIIRRSNARRHPHPRYSDILKRAWAGYRGSTMFLIRAAKALEDMSPHFAGPIASSVLHRLHVIARDALEERDNGTRRILGHHSKSIRSLASGLELPIVSPLSSSIVSARNNQASLDVPSQTFSPTESSSQSRKTVENPDLRMDVPGLLDKSLVIPSAIWQTPKDEQPHSSSPDARPDDRTKLDFMVLDKKYDGQSLTRRIHTQSRLMSSSEDSRPKAQSTTSSSPPTDDLTESSKPIKMSPKPTLQTNELSDQTLLEELFPETTLPPKPRVTEKRDQYPKLELPDYTPIVRREFVDAPKSMKEKIMESFQSRGEQTTVLQLAHCSTGLTEADFRRLIPKGKHMESWRREGEFFKIIPGRDPLSLERMPFYYILFKDPESALAYQKNASRLHKLSALHQPSNIFSAIPPPKGFLEDGEDLNKATSSYNLLPTHHRLSLSTLMQPYNPALRSLIERGGYQPIVPDVDTTGTRISKVLLHIEGYEPSPSDLFKIFRRDAYVHGMPLPLRNESSSSIHRLRDIINLKTSSKPTSSVSPRAYGTFDHDSPDDEHAASTPAPSSLSFDDPGIEALWNGADEDSSAKDVNQMIMNRVYNRWVLEFSDEDAAQRFVSMWHRKVLPDLGSDTGAWKDVEEVRFCNAEVLW